MLHVTRAALIGCRRLQVRCWPVSDTSRMAASLAARRRKLPDWRFAGLVEIHELGGNRVPRDACLDEPEPGESLDLGGLARSCGFPRGDAESFTRTVWVEGSREVKIDKWVGVLWGPDGIRPNRHKFDDDPLNCPPYPCLLVRNGSYDQGHCWRRNCLKCVTRACERTNLVASWRVAAEWRTSVKMPNRASWCDRMARWRDERNDARRKQAARRSPVQPAFRLEPHFLPLLHQLQDRKAAIVADLPLGNLLPLRINEPPRHLTRRTKRTRELSPARLDEARRHAPRIWEANFREYFDQSVEPFLPSSQSAVERLRERAWREVERRRGCDQDSWIWLRFAERIAPPKCDKRRELRREALAACRRRDDQQEKGKEARHGQ